MTIYEIDASHDIVKRDSTLICKRCQRYTNSDRKYNAALYDAGLKVPCDRVLPKTCACHGH